MTQQAMFFERIRAKRRSLTDPDKIAQKISPLAEWYRTNKPEVKILRVSPDDVHSLRSMWADVDKRNEVRMAGFNIIGQDIHWRGFDIAEAP